jgi:hypothetical protein
VDFSFYMGMVDRMPTLWRQEEMKIVNEYVRHSSVINGRDKDVLNSLFTLHAPNANRILDCTHNQGTMWRDTSFQPIRSDIDQQFNVDIISDFKFLPYAQGSLDVIVFDPPHLPTNAASKNSSKIWERRYGITDSGDGRDGDHVNGMFEPFLNSARFCLRYGGLVFAKIADLVHNHRYQWQHVEFILAAQKCGMTPCDLIIKCDPSAGKLTSSKWQNAHHFRKAHCYWIVVRNSLYCEGRP